MSDELENMLTEQQPEQVQEQPEKQEQILKEESPAEKKQEENWRQIRQRLDAYERERVEFKQYLENMQPKNAPQPQEDEIDIRDGEFVEGQTVKKYIKDLNKKLEETKKELHQIKSQSSEVTAEMRLKQEFPDYYSVVTEDNIRSLATFKPALYRSIMASPDLYDRGYSAYEMIKNSGLGQERYPEVDKKIEENRNKPKSAASLNAQVSDSPLSKANDYDRRVLTEERKEQLRRQVEEAKRNR